MLEHEDKLIQKAKEGDGDSFRALYNHYIEPIYRFVYLKVTNREEAEDLTHEVFLSSWQNLSSYKSRGTPFGSWLYRIARNKVIDHYRTRKPKVSLDLIEEEAGPAIESSESALDLDLDIRRVKGFFHKLTSVEKDVTIMRFIEGLSHEEIAAALGKSEGAVRLIQHRALNALRDLLKDDNQTTSV